MPRRALATVLLFLGLFVVIFAASFTGIGVRPAMAQDAHSRRGMIVLDDLSVEERQRARDLWSNVICNCPRENWSKTLTNCPDGCADHQKQTILGQIQQGLSDDQIYQYQIQENGTKVMAKPDDALTYALPALFLLLCGGATFVALRTWRKNAAAAHAAHQMDTPPDDDELAAVERELQELR